jgi:tetratricopeptide (TPR) repeat protein
MKLHIKYIFIILIFSSFSVQSQDTENISEKQSSSYWNSINNFWNSTKDTVSEKAEKEKDVLTSTEELRFENIYQRPFWKNDTVFWSAIAVASAGAAAFTVYTAGTGAPAAGAGVSYIASQLVAGGGAGSYMSGLATVGTWFGGNAITGAAILNASSAAAFSSVGKAISATTILVLTSATNFGDFGFMYLSLKEKNEATPVIQIIPSGNFGSGAVELLLTRLKDSNNKLTTALAKNKEVQTQLDASFSQAKTVIVEEYQFQPQLKTEMIKHLTQLNELNNKIIEKEKIIESKRLNNSYKIIIQETREMIDNYLTNKQSVSARNDAVMGTILLHTLGYKQDFVKYIKQFKVINQNESFLLYLKAVAYLFDKDFKLAKQYALQAIDSEPETIEPIMILIMALDGLDQYQQAFETEILLEETFDNDHYETKNSLITAYNLLGDIANARQLPQTAAKFHKKAFNNMSYLFSNKDTKAFICLKIANDYHMFGSKRQTTLFLEKALSYVTDDSLKQEVTRFFEEEIKTQLVLN